MAFSNQMSRLLNKIENRLGLKLLSLPEGLNKEAWAEVIMEETMLTFSRYFPYRIDYTIKKEHKGPDGYYYIDESLVEDVEILGVQDLDWEELRESQSFLGGNSYIDPYMNMGIESIALAQMNANLRSLTNVNKLFVESVPPNKFKISGIAGTSVENRFSSLPVHLLIVHNSLLTISPTMMETFERLALADVAGFLYQNLKYFDGLSTVYAQVDLKMDDIRNKAETRDECIRELEESYASTANPNSPIIMTI